MHNLHPYQFNIVLKNRIINDICKDGEIAVLQCWLEEIMGEIEYSNIQSLNNTPIDKG